MRRSDPNPAGQRDRLHVLVGLEQSATREISAHPLYEICGADIEAFPKQAAQRSLRNPASAARASVRQSALG